MSFLFFFHRVIAIIILVTKVTKLWKMKRRWVRYYVYALRPIISNNTLACLLHLLTYISFSLGYIQKIHRRSRIKPRGAPLHLTQAPINIGVMAYCWVLVKRLRRLYLVGRKALLLLWRQYQTPYHHKQLLQIARRENTKSWGVQRRWLMPRHILHHIKLEKHPRT